MFCSSCGAKLAEGSAFCSACGRAVAVLSTAPAPPAAGSAVVPAAAGAGVPAVAIPAAATAAGTTGYAGFWLRLVAVIIDHLALGIPFGFLFFVLFASAIPLMLTHPPDAARMVFLLLPRFALFAAMVLAGSWLYWSLMESSSWQATLGKKALGLYVTDLNGNRATFGRTSGRFFAGRGLSIVPSLGGLYYLVSCIMAGFTEKKQALHDMMASCLVMRKL